MVSIQVIEERFGQQSQLTELEQLTDEIQQTHTWMFEEDPVIRQPIYDRYSPWGQRALQHIQAAQQAGMTDPRMVWNYAQNAVTTEYMQQQYQQLAQQQAQQTPPAQPATPPAPEPTQAQRNAEYLKRQAKAASSPPGRNGATQQTDPESSGQRAGRRRSPGHDLLEELQRAGVAV